MLTTAEAGLFAHSGRSVEAEIARMLNIANQQRAKANQQRAAAAQPPLAAPPKANPAGRS